MWLQTASILHIAILIKLIWLSVYEKLLHEIMIWYDP